jgi:hypothetical protein
VIRIDPITGTISDSSQVILYGNASYPRMSIDAAGIVNVTNGGFSDGAFFSFNADLTLRWQTPIANVYIGGPLIGWDGTLVMCGVGNDIRAYRGELQASLFENSAENSKKGISLYPNVVNDYLNVSISNKLVGSDYIVTDMQGKKILSGKFTSENEVIDFTFISSGMYLFKAEQNEDQVYRIVKE